jgi:glycerol-3-phosphate dehydrogenase
MRGLHCYTPALYEAVVTIRNSIDVDVAIVGGGIAGLWLLNVLTQRGLDVLLLERTTLGDGQTIASQGLIHGGVKYALGGMLTGAADAVARMPARWRKCIEGAGEIDLRSVRVPSPSFYMWANNSALGQLGAFFASKAVRGRVRRLTRDMYPVAFAHSSFDGIVYELDDFVVDVPSLLTALAAPHAARIVNADVTPHAIQMDAHGEIDGIDLPNRYVRATIYVFAAGAGNDALIQRLGSGAPRMQRRALKQVLVRATANVPVYAHCIGGLTRPEPRLTITTHAIDAAGATYYLGGQLATDGVARGDTEQIAHARRELAELLPWLDIRDADFRVLAIDRAEPLTPGMVRPDQSFVARCGNVLVCWPTKLALAPDLGDRVLAALAGVPVHACSSSVSLAHSVPIATPPWGVG